MTQTERYKLIQGDCLQVMAGMESGSVDMVLADPPYGTTACKWDSIIPLEPMWEQLKRVIKPHGAIVLTASQPFATALIASSMELFKYEWIWRKNRPTDFPNAKNRPMKGHENVLVFSQGTTANRSERRMVYLPQGLRDAIRKTHRSNRGFQGERPNQVDDYWAEKTGYPASVLEFDVVSSNLSLHPTQKPVALMEYLVRTYTNEGETVLDFCMGSGTTGIACLQTGRKFIGIELDPSYFAIAEKRLAAVEPSLPLEAMEVASHGNQHH